MRRPLCPQPIALRAAPGSACSRSVRTCSHPLGFTRHEKGPPATSSTPLGALGFWEGESPWLPQLSSNNMPAATLPSRLLTSVHTSLVRQAHWRLPPRPCVTPLRTLG